MVKLYQKNIPFQSFSHVIEIIQEEPDHYVIISKNKCACDTKDGLSVWNNCIYTKSKQIITGDLIYSIDFDDIEELETGILWLVRSKFKRVVFQKNNFTLSSNFFNVSKMSCGCLEWKRKGLPVFFTKTRVIFRNLSKFSFYDIAKNIIK